MKGHDEEEDEHSETQFFEEKGPAMAERAYQVLNSTVENGEASELARRADFTAALEKSFK